MRRFSPLFHVCVLLALVSVSCGGSKSGRAGATSRPPAFDLLANTDLVDLLVKRKFDELEKALAFCLENNNQKDWYGGSALESAYKRLEYREDFLPYLNAWTEQRPNSHFAFSLRGQFYMKHAWAARGYGWASTVTSEGWQLFNERLKLAQDDLKKAMELNPNDPMPASLMIYVCMGLSLPREEMEKYFQTAVRIDPALYDPYSRKLEFLQPRWGGTEEDVLSFARESARNAPTGSRIPMILVDAHTDFAKASNHGPAWWKQPGVWKDVEDVYRKRLASQPDPIWDRNAFAKYALDAGQFNLAAEQFDLIGVNWQEGQWDKNFRTFLDARNMAFRNTGRKGDEKEWNESFIQTCSKAIEKQPDIPFLYYTRAFARHYSRHDPEAIADMTKAVELSHANGSDARFHFLFGVLYDELKKLDEALAQFEEALKFNPSDGIANFRKGFILWKKYQRREAIPCFENALKAYPTLTESRFYLAHSYLADEQYQKSIDEVTKALAYLGDATVKYRNNPKKYFYIPDLHNIRHFAFAKIEKYAEAIRDCQMYAELMPDQASQTYYNLAHIYLTAKDEAFRDPKQALNYSEKAVQLSGRQNSFMLEGLAMAYDKNGMVDEAIETSREVLRLKPDSTDAKEILERLDKPKP